MERDIDHRIVILNSFDRSGSSAISRQLAKHPNIELIFQPFNSGSLRKKMNIILDDQNTSGDDWNFFDSLQNGKLEASYIKSEWHKKYSTTFKIISGKLHIIKTTINHFSIIWLLKRFPGLSIWGIWRDPMSIVKSIVRNNFYTQPLCTESA